MKYEIGDKISDIAELRKAFTQDTGFCYRDKQGGTLIVRAVTEDLYKGDWTTPKDLSMKDMGWKEQDAYMPFTIILDPTKPVETEAQRLARDAGIEAGTWHKEYNVIITFDGDNLKMFWGVSCEEPRLRLTQWYDGKASPKTIISGGNTRVKIDPAEYVNAHIAAIYERSTDETAVKDTQEKYTVLNRALEIGLLKHGKLHIGAPSCPLCKQYEGNCTACPMDCETTWKQYLRIPSPETWGPLYEQIMALDAAPDLKTEIMSCHFDNEKETCRFQNENQCTNADFHNGCPLGKLWKAPQPKAAPEVKKCTNCLRLPLTCGRIGCVNYSQWQPMQEAALEVKPGQVWLNSMDRPLLILSNNRVLNLDGSFVCAAEHDTMGSENFTLTKHTVTTIAPDEMVVKIKDIEKTLPPIGTTYHHRSGSIFKWTQTEGAHIKGKEYPPHFGTKKAD